MRPGSEAPWLKRAAKSNVRPKSSHGRESDGSPRADVGNLAGGAARLIQNPKLTVHDIAREEQVSAAYLFSLLRLPWLAPDITTAIINGRKPPQLTAQTLMRLTPRLPAGWAEQRKLLGFR